MGINDFYEKKLGAKLQNRYSWGAYNQEFNRLFLTVWEDDIGLPNIDGKNLVRVLKMEADLSSGTLQRYKERVGHIEKMKSGSVDAYAVVAIGKRVDGAGQRSIQEFIEDSVFRLGKVIEEDDCVYAEKGERVPVGDLKRMSAG